jgi:hypothetical protein
MDGPTQRAVFDGSVQGVVVHARMYTGRLSVPKSGWEAPSLMTSNWTVAVVSVTSL